MIKRITNSTVNKTNPRWRYELLESPGKQGFSHCLSLASTKGGKSLLRYIGSIDLDVNVEWEPSQELKSITKLLPEDKAKQFSTLLTIYKKRKKFKRGAKLPQKTKLRFPLWSVREAEKLNDPFFVKLVKHATKMEHDAYIAAAISLYSNQDRKEATDFLGYSFYAGKTDPVIAKEWKLPVRLIEAIRLLFFDFSGFPKDRLANFTCLRQLVVNGIISDISFAFYKRIYELGDLGLKAQLDFVSLSPDEKAQVKEYLRDSHTATVFNLNFAVQNRKDSMQFLGALSSMTDLTVKQKDFEMIEARIENLKAATKKINTESATMETHLSDIDKKFMSLLYESSLTEKVPELKTIADLQ